MAQGCIMQNPRLLASGVQLAYPLAWLRPEVPRTKLLELIVNLLPSLIGMEACFGAQHWARAFGRFL
jgi:hypothetical protein